MDFRTPWEPAPAKTPQPPELPRLAKPLGRRPAVSAQVAARTASSSTWLYHHLTVNGPATPVAAFATAARGSGVIPW